VVALPPAWEGRLLEIAARSHATVLGLAAGGDAWAPGSEDLVSALGMRVAAWRLVVAVHNGHTEVEAATVPLVRARKGGKQRLTGSLALPNATVLRSSLVDDPGAADAAGTAGAGAAAAAPAGREVVLEGFRLDPMVVLRLRLEADVTHPPPPKDGRPALPGLGDAGGGGGAGGSSGPGDEHVRTMVVGIQEFPPFDGASLHLSNRADPKGRSVTLRPLEVPLRGAFTHSKVGGAVWIRDCAEFALEATDPIDRPRVRYSPATNVVVGMELRALRPAEGGGGSTTRVVYVEGQQREAEAMRTDTEAAARRAAEQKAELERAMRELEEARRSAADEGKDASAEMEREMRRLLDELQRSKEEEAARLRKEREDADARWRARLEEAERSRQKEAADRADAERRGRESEAELARLRGRPEPSMPPSRAGSASHITTPRDAPAPEPRAPADPAPPRSPRRRPAQQVPEPDDVFGAIAEQLTRPITPPMRQHTAVGTGRVDPTLRDGHVGSHFPAPGLPPRGGFSRPLTAAERALLSAHGYEGTSDDPAEEALFGISDLYVGPGHVEPELSDPLRASLIRIRLAALVPSAGGPLDASALRPRPRAPAGGASPSPSPAAPEPPSPSAPSRVYATFQLYSCMPTRTPPMRLVPAADDSGQGGGSQAAPSRAERVARAAVSSGPRGAVPSRPPRRGDPLDVTSASSASSSRVGGGDDDDDDDAWRPPGAAPGTLLLVDENGASGRLAPSFEFLVDPSASHPGDAVAFAEYLACASLQIELWDGDSHLPLGAAHLPLRSLLRRQRRKVTSGRAVDVLAVDPAAPAGSVTGDGAGPMSGVPGPSWPTGAASSSPAPGAGAPGSRVCTLHLLLAAEGRGGAGTFDAVSGAARSGRGAPATRAEAARAAALLASSAGAGGSERGVARPPALAGAAAPLPPADASTREGRRRMRHSRVTVEAKRLRAGAGRDLDDLLRAAGAGRTVPPSLPRSVEEVEDAPSADDAAPPAAPKTTLRAGSIAAPGSIADPGSLSLRETKALRAALASSGGADDEGVAVDDFVDLVYGGGAEAAGLAAATAGGSAVAFARGMPGASVAFWSQGSGAASGHVEDVGADRWGIPSRPAVAVDGLAAAALRAAAAEPSRGRDGTGVSDAAVLRVFQEAEEYAEAKRAARRRFLDDAAVSADAKLEATAAALQRAGAIDATLEPLQAATAFTAAESSVECGEGSLTAGRFRHTLSVRAGVHLTDAEFEGLMQRHAGAPEGGVRGARTAGGTAGAAGAAAAALCLVPVKHASVVRSILAAGDAADAAAAAYLAGGGTGSMGMGVHAARLPAEVVVAAGKVRTLARMVLSAPAGSRGDGERGCLRAALLEADGAGTGRLSWAAWKRVMEQRLGLRVVLRRGEDPYDAALAERQLRRAMAVERALRTGANGVLAGAAGRGPGPGDAADADAKPGAVAAAGRTGGGEAEEAEEARVRAAAIRALAAGGGGGMAHDGPSEDPQMTLLRLYREGRKRELVAGVLARAVTHSVALYPSCGRPCLVQLTVRNPFPHEERLRVVVDDPTGSREMRLVTDPAEWGFLRSVLPLAGPDPGAALVDGGAATGEVTAGSVTSGGHTLLAPMEAVTLGFVFLSFAPGVVRGAPGASAVPAGSGDVEAAARSLRAGVAPGRRPEAAHASTFRSAAFTSLALQAAEEAVVPGGTPQGAMRSPLAARTVTVRAVSTSHGSDVAVLRCSVAPRPFPVHRTLRFFQAEDTTLAARIRLPAPQDGEADPGTALAPGIRGSESAAASLRSGGGTAASFHASSLAAPGQFVHCADPRVVCEARSGARGAGRELLLRVRAGSFPEARDFLVLLYNDPFCASLHECWRVVVHSVVRCDLSGTLGSRSELELVVRSDGRARRVRVASTIPRELWCPMAAPIGLTGGAYNRLRLAYQPSATGSRRALVHVADVDTGALVCAWEVGVTTAAPVISKEYDLVVRGAAATDPGKRLVYTNPWDEARAFRFTTDRPDLVRIRDDELALAPRDTEGTRGHVRLTLRRRKERGAASAFVFVESDAGGLEEVLLLRIAYV